MRRALFWRNRIIFAGIIGVACLNWVAQHYRVDTIAERCPLWPSLASNIALALVYGCGIALTTWTWLQTTQADVSEKNIWLLGSSLHLLALVSPPYLSIDSLYYIAIGKVLRQGGSVYQALNQTLAPDDSLLQLLPPAWQFGTSPYPKLFNQWTHLVAWLGPNGLRGQLLIYQLCGFALVAASAFFVGRAVKRLSHCLLSPAQATALVLLCPLGIVEATQNAHNDAFLMLFVALGALLLAQSRPLLALLAVAAGFAWKASALIPFSLFAAVAFCAHLTRRSLTSLGVAILFLAATALLYWGSFQTIFGHSLALFGSAHDAIEHCTRSWECIPRAVLHYAVNQPDAAWWVGICFRGLSVVWLAYAGWQAARSNQPIAAIGRGVFIYYLFFHGYMQSWYLLVLLPLLPFADRSWLAAQKWFLTTLVLYYPINLIFQCGSEAGFLAREVIGGFLTVGLTAWYWALLQRRQSQLRGTASS